MRPERDPNADGRPAAHPDGVSWRVIVISPHVEARAFERGSFGVSE